MPGGGIVRGAALTNRRVAAIDEGLVRPSNTPTRGWPLDREGVNRAHEPGQRISMRFFR